MKTTVLKTLRFGVLILAVTLFNVTGLKANNNKIVSNESEIVEKNIPNSQLPESISNFFSKKISYPNSLMGSNENISLQFTVNENGTLSILDIKSSNEKLVKYLKTKIESYKVKTADIVLGEIYNVSINFLGA